MYDNYVGKVIGDYIISEKIRGNRRIKYNISCTKCGFIKNVYNVSNPNLFKHTIGGCLGIHNKTGSNMIGKVIGDYVIVQKDVVNNRSLYIARCTKCDSIRKLWNIRDTYHSIGCSNFCDYEIGKIVGDYVITNIVKNKRTYVDCKCVKCGTERTILYKDFVSRSNNHSTTCIKVNNLKYDNKELVEKLLRTYQSLNTRIRKDPAYSDVKNLFEDSYDFITYVYDMYKERLDEGIDLQLLSIDRINPFGNYERGNVRCLTIVEQQYNKRKDYIFPCKKGVDSEQ